MDTANVIRRSSSLSVALLAVADLHSERRARRGSITGGGEEFFSVDSREASIGDSNQSE